MLIPINFIETLIYHKKIKLYSLAQSYIISFHVQVGGNKNAMEFFKSQPDWKDSMSIEQKYNTKAAALYRDKVNILEQFIYFLIFDNFVFFPQILKLAKGEQWSPTTSSAKDFNVDYMKM